MKRYLISLIFPVLLAGTSCQEKVGIEVDIEAINNLTEEYDAAINSGDLGSCMSVYADDAVRMPPNSPTIVGKDAIRNFYQPFFEQRAININETCEEVIVCGDWAFVWGTYTYTITPKMGGETSRDSGKWTAYHKRQPDGSLIMQIPL